MGAQSLVKRRLQGVFEASQAYLQWKVDTA